MLRLRADENFNNDIVRGVLGPMSQVRQVHDSTTGRGDRRMRLIWVPTVEALLADERLKEAGFICTEGPTIIVPAEELKRVLLLGDDHYGSQIWGPFSIDPQNRTVDRRPVNMMVVGERQ